MKKSFLFCLLFLIGSTSEAQNKSAVVRYPVITIANGKIELVEGDKAKPLKVNEGLKEKATIRVGEKSQARVDISTNSFILALQNTDFKFPFIAWEDGKVEQVELLKGRIHVTLKDGQEKTVVTALSRDFLTKGEYVYTYEPLVPKVDVMVISGELEFRGLENEESIKLKSGERASFIGVLESGEPVYDTLLKGRRVARGKLSKVEKIPGAEMKEAQAQSQVKKVIIKKVVPVKRTGDDICDKPFGKLNECVWTCDKNPKKAKSCDLKGGAVCVRQRCNANGEWAERTELPELESKCTLKRHVAPCDY